MSIYILIIIVSVYFIFRIGQKIHQSRLIKKQNEKINDFVNQNLLEFDREIDQILNHPNLSKQEKEHLTNSCIEKFTHNLQSK